MRLQLVCLHLSVDLLAVVQSREDVLRLQLAVDKRNLILFIVFFKISLTKLKLILSLKLIVALFFFKYNNCSLQSASTSVDCKEEKC